MLIEISTATINYLLTLFKIRVDSNNYVDKIRKLQQHKLLLNDATYKIINSESSPTKGRRIITDKFCGKFKEKQTITTLQNNESTVTIERVILDVEKIDEKLNTYLIKYKIQRRNRSSIEISYLGSLINDKLIAISPSGLYSIYEYIDKNLVHNFIGSSQSIESISKSGKGVLKRTEKDNYDSEEEEIEVDPVVPPVDPVVPPVDPVVPPVDPPVDPVVPPVDPPVDPVVPPVDPVVPPVDPIVPPVDPPVDPIVPPVDPVVPPVDPIVPPVDPIVPPVDPPVDPVVPPVDPVDPVVPPVVPPPSIPHATPGEHQYFRLFDTLPGLNSLIDDLELLASIMQREDNPEPALIQDINIPDPLSIGSTMPAIITYFGQFIDHDITAERRSILGQATVDVSTLVNERTSGFDLDSVYGKNNEYLTVDGGTKFLIVQNSVGEEDLPRDPITGLALMPDQRNEENLIILHIHLACLKFHNRVIDELRLKNQFLTSLELVNIARRIVVFHYQHMVIHEFLKKILLPSEFERIFVNHLLDISNSRIYAETPKMPVEVSGAIYRFGHAMVRNEYYLNINEELPIFSLRKPQDLRGMRPLPPGLHINWHLFTPMPNHNGFQVTEKIGPSLVQNLFALPLNNNDSLTRRNLVRGNVLNLPSGQSICKYLGIPYLDNSNADPNFRVNIALEKNFAVENSLDPETLITPEILSYLNMIFGNDTPCWYYILKEAEVFGNGNCLGPLASRIIGEYFWSLLKKSQTSILNHEFTPTIGEWGCVKTGEYLFCDWLAYSFNLPIRDPAIPLPTAERNNLHVDLNPDIVFDSAGMPVV
jgi:hypothetical protein